MIQKTTQLQAQGQPQVPQGMPSAPAQGQRKVMTQVQPPQKQTQTFGEETKEVVKNKLGWKISTTTKDGKTYSDHIQMFVKKTDKYVFEVLADSLTIGKVQLGVQDNIKKKYYSVYVNAATFLALSEGITSHSLIARQDKDGGKVYYRQQGGTSKWRAFDLIEGQSLPYTLRIKEGVAERTATGGTACKKGTMEASCFVGLSDFEAREMAAVAKAIIGTEMYKSMVTGNRAIFGE